jgi:hypothetical protein
MKNKVRKEGRYELFVTSKNHHILTLDNKEWFAIVKGQQGEIMVGSDSDHEKKKNLMQGKYLLVDFDDDPEFRDIPHLFLEKSGKFEEWILPNKLPSGKGEKVKIINTKNKIEGVKIFSHVSGKAKKEEKRSGKLEVKSKNELLDIARQKNIKGRSKMSNEELISELSESN